LYPAGSICTFTTEITSKKSTAMQTYRDKEETDIDTLMRHTLIVLTIFMAIALFTFMFFE